MVNKSYNDSRSYVSYTPGNSVGVGWEKLIDPLVQLCEAYGGQVQQVKEKFGGLRFYYGEGEGNRKFWEMFGNYVDAAENASYYTCEKTGKAGSLRAVGEDGKPRWWRTLSDEAAGELGYQVDDD